MKPRYTITEQVLAAFWARVQRNGDDECWPWLGAKTTKGGYGRVCMPGRVEILASHVAYFIRTKKYITGVARHKCDDPGCANPNHVLDGTQFDNVRDSIERGRFANNMVPGNRPSRFTKEDFEKMCAALKRGVSQKEVAREHGISPSYLCNLITQRRTPRDLRHMQKFSRAKLTGAQMEKMKAMRRGGHTYSQISQMTGVPEGTVSWYLRKEGVDSPIRKLRPKK